MADKTHVDFSECLSSDQTHACLCVCEMFVLPAYRETDCSSLISFLPFPLHKLFGQWTRTTHLLLSNDPTL